MRECSSPSMCHIKHVICHMSHVMWHVSRVTCHMSSVTCHMSQFLFFYLCFFRHSGGASWWGVCYQQGLPRLVFTERPCGPIQSNQIKVEHRCCFFLECIKSSSLFAKYWQTGLVWFYFCNLPVAL